MKKLLQRPVHYWLCASPAEQVVPTAANVFPDAVCTPHAGPCG